MGARQGIITKRKMVRKDKKAKYKVNSVKMLRTSS